MTENAFGTDKQRGASQGKTAFLNVVDMPMTINQSKFAPKAIIALISLAFIKVKDVCRWGS